MNPPKLAGLQALRGLAAIMVLTGHVLAEAEHYFALPLPGDAIPWTRGVDIFFVISGFVITLSAARYANQPAAFLWRRLLRVVPLYFLFTTIMVATLLLLPSGPKDTVFNPAQILSSYSFIPFARDDGRIAPVLSLGWTLNYEVFFYVAMALCLALPRPLLAVCAVFGCLAALGSAFTFTSTPLAFWTNAIIIEFTFGIALARLWQHSIIRPHAGAALAAFLLGAALLVLLDETSLPRFLAAGLPATLIVAAGTLLCPPLRLPRLGLGDASYALYLSHRFTLRAATLLLLPLLPASPLGAAAYVAVTLLASVACALLIHRHVERPMMRSFATARHTQATA